MKNEKLKVTHVQPEQVKIEGRKITLYKRGYVDTNGNLSGRRRTGGHIATTASKATNRVAIGIEPHTKQSFITPHLVHLVSDTLTAPSGESTQFNYVTINAR